MKKLLYLIPLFFNLCFAAEPQFYLRNLETPKDTQAVNENFRNVAGEIKVAETNISDNTSNISDLQNIVSNLRGYLNGLILENDSTDSDHDIKINIGMARSADNDTTINLEGPLIKQIDATWSAGNNQGGRASGVSLTSSTWYHLFIIYNPTTETTDVVFDTSITNANAPSGYTEFRRIGSVFTDGSSNIYAFKQIGDTFYWKLQSVRLNVSSTSISANLLTLLTPLDVSTEAIINLSFWPAINTTYTGYILLTNPDQTDTAPTSAIHTARFDRFFNAYSDGTSDRFKILTNTSSQIRYRASDANSVIVILSEGWRDFLDSGNSGGGSIGITSLNGLTNNTQTFAVGTAGTDFAISSSGSTHTFNLPTASGSNRGALSSADWTTFNSKLDDVSGEDHSTLNNLSYVSAGHTGFEPTVTKGNLTATSPLNQTGGTNAVIGSGVSLTIDDASISQKGSVQLSNSYVGTSQTLATTEKALSDGLVTKEDTLSKGNLTEDTSNILTITGGNNAVIGGGTTIEVAQASALQSGYLSSTDWSIFNSKENVLTFSTGLNRSVNTITTNDSEIVHDNLSGFVSNEHIDHSGVNINSGGILSGGGDITATRTITLAHSDVDHDQTTNTHNLTTDIDHNQLTNYVAGEHFLQSAITQISNSVSDGILTTASGTLGSITDNSANWNTAYGWGDHSTEGYLKNIVEDTTPQLGGDLDPNGKKLLADLDFNHFEAVRMVCDNDTVANIPNTGNEVDGQWFYANDVKILYQYEQGWQPMVNFGTVNIYVDAGSGSDAVGKGFSSGSGAFATIVYAVDNIPCTVAGDIIINIASGTYSETIIVQGKTICGNYTITFKGTLSELESGTIDSAVDSTTASLGTITDTGAFTGDSYQNKLVWIQNIDDTWGAGGDFHYRIIDSHTNDTLTLVGTSTTMSGQWKVYDWLTTIDGLLLAQGGQKSIVIEDIKFTGGEEWEDRVSAIGTKDYSSVSVRRCKLDSLDGYAVRMWYNSVLETYYSYLGAGTVSAQRGIGLFQWQNIFLSRASKNYGNGTQNGFFFTLSFTAVLQGNTIVENNGIGVFANNQGLLLSNLGLFVRNNTTGIRTDLGCVQNLSSINYSGNTTDTDFRDTLIGVITIDDILELEPRTAAPTSPQESWVYYDSTLKKHRGYDGTSWNNFY
jgi:hypothetical protein